MILPFVLLLALGSFEYATGACGKCASTSRAMCMSETTFKRCKDPVTPGEPLVEDPDSPIIKCPDGKHCSQNEVICIATGTPDCINKCGKCNDKKVFACVSGNQYAFCFGEATPDPGFIGTCPVGEFCNSDLVSRYCATTATPTCVDGQEEFPTTVSPPTTPTTPTTASTGSTGSTPTTPPPTSSPNDYCKTRPPGRYPVAGSSCTKYIFCNAVGGSMVGQEYDCQSTTVFDPYRQKCVLSTAYHCPPNM